jgi:hypothetical protein
MSIKTEVIRIKDDGNLDDDVYVLLGPYALSNESRTLQDLNTFLKISKGIQGNPKYFIDREMKDELTADNYNEKKAKAIGGKLFLIIE